MRNWYRKCKSVCVYKGCRVDIFGSLTAKEAVMITNSGASSDEWLIEVTVYTAHQLCGITLLVPPFCLTAGRNPCQCQYEAFTISTRPLVLLWQTLMDDHHFCPVQVSLLSREGWFPHLLRSQYGAFVLISSSCGRHYMQITIPSQSVNHANQYPACNYWKLLFASQAMGFLSGRCGELLECHKVPYKLVPCLWGQRTYPLAT